MTVPKASIDKHHCSVFREDDIRMTRKIFVMEGKAESLAKQVFSHQYFHFGVFALDVGHDPTSL